MSKPEHMFDELGKCLICGRDYKAEFTDECNLYPEISEEILIEVRRLQKMISELR